ncbi:probable ATP-dependent RNA helicase ddx42 [Brassica rapa]|uniref:probable ATP-dependent RNA helicase ddx42 n=1 Tax=Brassica campestris TaxID=3711 RepID=UPI0004F19096|nr:probable ATP-dependent RNA helicase ddx42 [Brassica rapa]
MALDSASDRNFNTRNPEEAIRLIENLASNNITKNTDFERNKSAHALGKEQLEDVKAKLDSNQRSGNQSGYRNSYGNGQRSGYNQSSQYQKSYNSNYNNNNNNKPYGNSYYQNQPQQTRQSKIESMLDQVLESQQNLMVNFNGKIYDVYIELNSNFKSLNTHVRKLKKKVVQKGDTIKRQETFMKGKGDDSLKHHVNAIMDDDFWQLVKEEKLQEGDFHVESSMNFGGSH